MKSNKNVFSGLPTAVVGISSAQTTEPISTPVTAEEEIGITEQPVNVIPDTNVVEPITTGKSSASILDALVNFGKQNFYLSIIVALAIVLLVVYGIKNTRRRKNQ